MECASALLLWSVVLGDLTILLYINDISQVADDNVADQIIDNVRKRMTNEKPRKLPNNIPNNVAL